MGVLLWDDIYTLLTYLTDFGSALNLVGVGNKDWEGFLGERDRLSFLVVSIFLTLEVIHTHTSTGRFSFLFLVMKKMAMM